MHHNHVAHDSGRHGKHTAHDHTSHMKIMWHKFLVSLLLTIPILLLSPTVQTWVGVSLTFPGSAYIVALLGTAIYFYGGEPFLRGALREIRARQPGMMTLISLAVSVAYFYSVSTLFDRSQKAFFWELATLIDIMLLGHYIEAKSILGASDALQSLVKLLPKHALRITPDGKTEEVPVDRLKSGDSVLVRPGDTVPVDGEVDEGESLVDESMLTGESRPVPKGPGDRVFAGSTNIDGAMRIHITKSGAESYLAQMIALVEAAQQSRSKTQDLANKAAGWLFYGALGVGGVTFAVWSSFAPLSEALLRTVTVLVIACPHALGLAVPLVVATSTTLGAKRGILIRNRQAFETLADIDVVCLDKTGTVTKGELEVTRMVTAGHLDETTLLSMLHALEQRSEHIIAQAVVRFAEEHDIRPMKVTSFKSRPGIGTEATVEGISLAAGGIKMLETDGLATPPVLETFRHAEATTVWVVVEGRVEAVLLLEDTLRESSPDAVARLKEAGVEVWMLTGDNPALAKRVAREVGIDHLKAGLLPDEKTEHIRRLKKEGKRVAMVGDGVNDAPSLLSADVGIAIGAGTDIAIESADIILIRSDLTAVVHALRLSRRTLAKMKQNLWWASGYNLVAVPLAAGVLYPWGILVDPAVGAVLMSLSTVIVAVNAKLLAYDRDA